MTQHSGRVTLHSEQGLKSRLHTKFFSFIVLLRSSVCTRVAASSATINLRTALRAALMKLRKLRKRGEINEPCAY